MSGFQLPRLSVPPSYVAPGYCKVWVRTDNVLMISTSGNSHYPLPLVNHSDTQNLDQGDDHPQYLNNSRGDSRYVKKTDQNVYGTGFFSAQRKEDFEIFNNQYQNYLSLAIPANQLEAGDYKIKISYVFNYGSTGRSFRLELKDGASQLFEHVQELKDAGSTQRVPACYEEEFSVSQGQAKNFSLNVRSQSSADRCGIYYARIEFKRVR